MFDRDLDTPLNSLNAKRTIAFLKKLGFTPCKAEKSLRDMELQENEAQKDNSIQEISLERTYRLKVSVNSRFSHLDHRSKKSIL